MGVEGDGIARTQSGRMVFVAGTLAGETVEAVVDGKRGVLRDVLVASASRADAPCPHFPACGGCRMQHLPDDAYAAWKRALLTGAVVRAGFGAETVAPIMRVPAHARRRADFALRRDPALGMAGGFHAPGSDAIVNLQTCLVLRPDLFALLAGLRAAAHGLAALRRDGSAVVTMTAQGADVLLRTDRGLAVSDRRALAGAAVALGLARLSWAGTDQPETLIAARPSTMTFGGHDVRLPPGAFVQATAEGEAAIVAAVLAGLDGLPSRPALVDLYAGCGTLSLPLTARGRVAAYEGDAASAAALRAAAPPGKLTVFARDLVRQPLRAAELARTDAVVLDPPHAGAAVQVAEIVRSAVPRVVYVTCNPQTFERDAMALREGGFTLTRATPIDQFLWSARLEAVCVFARAARRSKASSPVGRGLG